MIEARIKYDLYVRTRDDDDFYTLMGRFFGSREIAKALGMPMYDDLGRIWVIAIDRNNHPIACSSIEMKGKKAAMKSAWVDVAYRGQGIYNQMFLMRLEIAKQCKVQIITSTATQMSKSTHERYGFQFVGMRGQYFLYRKDLSLS